MANKAQSTAADQADAVRQTLLEMEPELHTLRGVLIAFQTFAAQPEPVETAAIAVLERCGEKALDKLVDLWRSLLPAVASR